MIRIMEDKNINITDRVLKEIKEKEIEPKAKWHFLVHDYSVFVLAIVSIIIGSFAFSAIIFTITNSDFALYKDTYRSFGSYIFDNLPLVWLLFLIVFGGSAYYNLKNTKGGYKYKLSTLIIGTVLASMILGTGLYALGGGGFVDRSVGQHIPFHKGVEERMNKMWSQPDKGLLFGVIGNVEENSFELNDRDNTVWIVLSDEETDTRVPVREGVEVKIIGEKIDEEIFEACLIVPGVLRGEKNTEKHFGLMKKREFTEGRPGGFERKSVLARSIKCESVQSYK